MEQIVLTEEELKSLNDFKVRQSQLILELGQNEFMNIALKNQKNQILQNLDYLKQEEEKLGMDLNEKYGDGNIDLDTGIFSKV
jgi:7,8-dihydro-6-hydroxymethylpterin-pyrophosphokinase